MTMKYIFIIWIPKDPGTLTNKIGNIYRLRFSGFCNSYSYTFYGRRRKHSIEIFQNRFSIHLFHGMNKNYVETNYSGKTF